MEILRVVLTRFRRFLKVHDSKYGCFKLLFYMLSSDLACQLSAAKPDDGK